LAGLEAEAPADAAPPEPDEPEILDLTEAMEAPSPTGGAPGFRTIDAQSDVMFAERGPRETRPPEPAPLVAEPRRPISQPAPERPLLSSATSAAVDSAFNTLAQTVLIQNARTLEDLVREMLRPMLKTWLDDNLPGLVERLVRAEIERVSRGRA
jgi:cell pole-organizing protein PopZ